MICIYQIFNNYNGKYYVGSTINFEKRCMAHKTKLNLNKHKNRHLQAAWNKYGIFNFDFKVLEIVENNNKLIEREQYWIDRLKSYDDKFGYNIRKIAESNLGLKGNKHSEETKRKISEAHKGKKASEATKLKMSLKRKGRKLSLEHILKFSLAQIGRVQSEETKLKISIAKKNIRQSKEQIANRVLSIRKNSRWSCAEGRKCKCEKCLDIKRKDNKKYKLNIIGKRLVNNEFLI